MALSLIDPSNPRTSKRVFAPGPVAADIPGAPAFAANAFDLSEGGICLLLPQEVKRGDVLVFSLDEGDRPRTFDAVVRYVGQTTCGWRAGLEWKNLAASDREALQRLVAQLVEKGAEVLPDPGKPAPEELD